RAEDYVKKPISAQALLENVRALITLEAPVVEHDEATDEHTEILSREQVDDEIEAFAENAFDSLVFEDEEGEDLVLSEPATRDPSSGARRSVPEITIDEDADSILD